VASFPAATLGYRCNFTTSKKHPAAALPRESKGVDKEKTRQRDH